MKIKMTARLVLMAAVCYAAMSSIGAVTNAPLAVIDPTITPEYNAARVWQPIPPPADAPAQPYRCRIVSYADKWTRHGLSTYMSWRWPNGPLVKRAEDYLEISRDYDVDGDGQTNDDFIAALPFSLDTPLSNPSWPRHMAFPERISARFYGGAALPAGRGRDE